MYFSAVFLYTAVYFPLPPFRNGSETLLQLFPTHVLAFFHLLFTDSLPFCDLLHFMPPWIQSTSLFLIYFQQSSLFIVLDSSLLFCSFLSCSSSHWLSKKPSISFANWLWTFRKSVRLVYFRFAVEATSNCGCLVFLCLVK